MTSFRRFDVHYSRWWRWLFSISGLGPRWTAVELRENELYVRMGWAFRATIPRSSIATAARAPDWYWAIGVHTNLKGSWLVNGSPHGLVSLELSPPVEGRCAGIRVTVRRLGLGLVDPDSFLTALGAPGSPSAGAWSG
jgi:hypothetical protein